MLPKDLWERSLCFLDLADIGRAAAVCRAVREATADDSSTVWKELAERKYGTRIVQATIELYDANYRAMLQDDNQRGALPTLYRMLVNEGDIEGDVCWACPYTRNRPNYYFCCLIACIKYDCRNDNLLLYIDARGEPDLRRPETSGLWRNQRPLRQEDTQVVQPLGAHFEFQSYPHHHDLPLGHYKGVLTIDAAEVMNAGPGTIRFCYANRARFFCDYRKVSLFEILPGQTSWKQVFAAAATATGGDGTVRKVVYTLPTESPFDGDTEQVERARWARVTPEKVMNRHLGSVRGVWWV